MATRDATKPAEACRRRDDRPFSLRTDCALAMEDHGLREEPLLSPPSPRGTGSRRPSLGILSVLSLIFFNVSGGPLGSEGIISAGGPIVGLSSILGFASKGLWLYFS